MKFYTNVQQWGNNLLVRGVDSSGRRVMQRYKDYSPTLFISSPKPSKYQTLDGKYVDEFKPGSIKESREFLERYKDVPNHAIYGQTQFVYQWISDNFIDEREIPFDTSKVSIMSLDIETSSEEGFPNIETAIEQVLLITVKESTSKMFVSWGLKPFDNKYKDVEYRYFEDEKDMLRDFIKFLNQIKPDVITLIKI